MYACWDSPISVVGGDRAQFIRVRVYTSIRIVFWGIAQDTLVCCSMVGLVGIAAQRPGAGTLV